MPDRGDAERPTSPESYGIPYSDDQTSQAPPERPVSGGLPPAKTASSSNKRRAAAASCVALFLLVAFFGQRIARLSDQVEPQVRPEVVSTPGEQRPSVSAPGAISTSSEIGAGEEVESEEETGAVSAFVLRVIDGDTIEVLVGDQEIDVRLIGVDTPETVHPSEPVGCFGRRASSFTKRSLESKDVALEFDVEKTDRYGRALAYVWLEEKLFNEQLLRRGFALVSTFPPNVKYVDRFVAAQRQARKTKAGLWRSC